MIGVFIPLDDRPRRKPQGWVIQESGCWDWVGTLSQGYGRMRGASAHRIAYEQAKGPIPEGLTIDHLCRNRACGNPDHMQAVTNRENVLRGVGPTARNARKTHCPKGHPFDEANTFTGRGYRECRTCWRERERGRISGWERQRRRKNLSGANEETPHEDGNIQCECDTCVEYRGDSL